MSTTFSIDPKISDLSRVSDELLNQFIQILVSNYESGAISTVTNGHSDCLVIAGTENETELLYLESSLHT